MALITYVGGVESNSFVRLAEAGELIEELFEDISEWEDLSAFQQELRLQLAAQLMGHMPLRGRTVFRNQGLCFPRTSQQYNQRFQIPEEAKRGQVYIAFDVVHRTLAAQPEVEAGLPSTFGKPSQISLAGLLSVSFAEDRGVGGGTILERIVGSMSFPVQMIMKKWLSQIRGGTVLDSSDERTLSTTTVPIVTTTTTPVVTTTTTI